MRVKRITYNSYFGESIELERGENMYNLAEVIASAVLTIAPMFYGIAKWSSLPDKIAIHFSLNGTPDNFVSKPFAVVGIPIVLLCILLFSVFTKGVLNTETVTAGGRFSMWFIAIISVIVQVVIYVVALKH